MKKRPDKWVMFLSLMGIVLLTLILRYFLAPHWVALIVAVPLGVWLYFENKRFCCPHCHAHLGKRIRFMDTCPRCGFHLRIE